MTDTRSPDAEPEQDEWVPVPPAFHITNVPRSPDGAAMDAMVADRTAALARSPDAVEALRDEDELVGAARYVRFIEAEARADERARIRAEVEGLPAWDPHYGPPEAAYERCRAAVLALLEPKP